MLHRQIFLLCILLFSFQFMLNAQGNKLPDGESDMMNEASAKIRRNALSRTKLIESDALKKIRKKEPEPGPGKLIYKDDFESYKVTSTPKHWEKTNCRVVQSKTVGNKTKVIRYEPTGGGSHAYMSRKITATNFRLKYDFLCGNGGEVTWLIRLNGERGHSLWSNENYYQAKFYTKDGKPLTFGMQHLWTGGGYPFVNAKQPGVRTNQKSYQEAWHRAELTVIDDRIIVKLNGTRVLDAHYPILMARTKKSKKYGFGLMARDSHSSSKKNPYVWAEWFDNIELYDLGGEVRERHWPAELHVAPWGKDTNSGKDQAHPFKTLKKAFQEMYQGDRLVLQEGTYDGDITWSNPKLCDLTSVEAKRKDYPSFIEAAPYENVTITGSWKLENCGELRINQLTFSGSKSALDIKGKDAKATRILNKLSFTNKSKGLRTSMAKGAKLNCIASSFKGSSLNGSGLIVKRSVFLNSPVKAAQARISHCTVIGSGTIPKGQNVLKFSSLAVAAKSLVNPAKDRFDLKKSAKAINKGRAIKKDLIDKTVIVGKPDLGAFEYYPPRKLTVKGAAEIEDELTGDMVEQMPMKKRRERLSKKISSLRPGDTLYVAPGLWSESGISFSNLRGTSYAPIRVIAKPALGAIVHGGIRFSNCDNLEVTGFRFAGYKGTKKKAASTGLSWSKCGRTLIKRCEITEYGHAGIAGEEQGVTLLQNWIHHNGKGGRNHGIYWAGIGPTWVIGNTFYGNSGWGIHLHAAVYDGWHPWKIIAHHNLFIKGNAIVTTGSRGEFYNNTMYASAVSGLWFYNDGHMDNRIANNIFYKCSMGFPVPKDGNFVSHNLAFKKQGRGKALITGNPEFINPQKNNFKLSPGSPALKAGMDVGFGKNGNLGAYDHNTQWAPPLPLPKYIPLRLKKTNKEMKKAGEMDLGL